MKSLKIIFIFLFFMGSYFIFNSTWGYSAESVDDIFQEETELYVDEMKSFPASTPKRVVVGNPKVADVGDVSENSVMIVPKAPGVTSFIFWDVFGEHSYRLRVMAENPEDIKLRIDALLSALNISEVSTKTSRGEAKVFILGEVKTLDDKERLITALGGLAEKTINLIKIKEETAVVDIDVQVLELSEGASKILGLTWPSGAELTEVGSPGIQSVGVKWSTLFKVLNLKRDAFSFKLDALIEEGKAHVLSRPRLACQSGKEAELLVGGEKPVFTTSSASATTGSSTSVSYKEYGIKLKIKPQVTEEKRIKVALNVDISELEAAEGIGTTSSGTTTTTAIAYPTTKRTTSTELFMNSGQTLTIGGLIRQKSNVDVSKTPLGNLPVLGMLFRKRSSTSGGGTGEKGNRELFILLTPTIIKEEKKPGSVQATNDLIVRNNGSILNPSGSSNENNAFQKEVDPEVTYAENVKRTILENLTYSSLAKEAGDEGTVTLSLRLSSEGKLLAASVRKSSGSPALDTSTLSIAREIFYYPAFPPSIKQQELQLEIPIVYKLD